MASTVLPNGIIVPEKFSRDWYADLYHNWQELDNLLGGGTPKDGTLTIQKNGTTVGTFSANQATDETINIEVPDVNNGTLTIQQNGTTVDTFTANSSSDKTVNISVPTKTSDLTNDSGYITGVSWNDVSNKPSFAAVATSGSYNDLSNKPTIPTNTNELTNGAGFITADYAVPRSGGAVMTGDVLARTVDNSWIQIWGGSDFNSGANLLLSANNSRLAGNARFVLREGIIYYFETANFAPGGAHVALGGPGYEWGQIYSTNSTIATSDARLKNSIKDIDDALLDAWGNIEPKQYKFNDATEKKGEKARFHTGYLAQDIQAECEKRGVNASDYGLFCYDEWDEREEESEEIETEKDGKIVKEKRVIQPKREKGNSYALRYEEALVVECKYLRRCIARLTARIEELEKGNNTK